MTNPDPHGLFEAAYSEVSGGRRAVEPKRSAVRVKPLEWSQVGANFIADGGNYVIERRYRYDGDDHWYVISTYTYSGRDFGSLSAAKAAAQADFEARIRSAIDGGDDD